MSDQELSRTGYNRIDNVQNPTGAEPLVAWVSEADLRQIFKLSLWRFHNLRTAVGVLQRPGEIWRALRQVREEEVLGYAYVGKPAALHAQDGTRYDLPAGRVFLAFLDLRMTLIEWRTEADPPQGLAEGDRFKELLWSR